MTAAVSVLFCASAAVAVLARVSTVKENVAVSGTVVTLPFPVTVIVFGGAVVADLPKGGCAMPLSAEAASRSSAEGMIQRSLGFMPRIRHGAADRHTAYAVAVPSSPRYGPQRCGIRGAASLMNSTGCGAR